MESESGHPSIALRLAEQGPKGPKESGLSEGSRNMCLVLQNFVNLGGPS